MLLVSCRASNGPNVIWARLGLFSAGWAGPSVFYLGWANTMVHEPAGACVECTVFVC